MTKEEEVRLNAMLMTLQNQRDQALLQVGQLSGELAVVKMQLEALQPKPESNVVDMPQAG